MSTRPLRALAASFMAVAALGVAACGGDDKNESGGNNAARGNSGSSRTSSASTRRASWPARAKVEAAIRDCMKQEGFEYVPVDPIAQRAAATGSAAHQRRGLPQPVRLRHQHPVGPRRRQRRSERALPAHARPGRPARLRPGAHRRQPGRDVLRGG